MIPQVLRRRRMSEGRLSSSTKRDEIRARRRSASLAVGFVTFERLECRTLLATTPSVTTLAVANITATSATLNGTVDPNGASANASFQYSTDPSVPPTVVSTLAGTAGQAGSTNGTGTAALFNDPEGIAFDPVTGNIYVADRDNDTIRKITPDGVVSTFAGSPGQQGSANGLGPNARFNRPAGVAVNPANGNVYVADTHNNTIRVISPNGFVNTLAGTAGVIGHEDGVGPAAEFISPVGIAVNTATGLLVVADSDNSIIRTVTPDGDVNTLAGKPADGAHPGDGTGFQAGFDLPTYVTVDPVTGNAFVSDDSDAVRKVTPAGVVTRFAGDFFIGGSADGTGRLAQFAEPSGIAFDPTTGNLFVADSGNNTIRMITPSGFVSTLAGALEQSGSADGAGGAAKFNFPQSIAFDPSTGRLFVADSFNDTIRVVTPQSVSAQAGLTGTSSLPVTATLSGLAPGTTYYVRAAATSAGGDALGPIVSFTTPSLPPVAPSANTGAASGLTGTTATLNATVNPEGSTTTAQFVYGTDPTLGAGVTTSADLPLGHGSSDLAVHLPLTGLAPNTTYFFEVSAGNVAGTTSGGIQSFRTPAQIVAPTAETNAATNITKTGATLHGTATPNSAPVDTSFQYSTDPSFTPTVVSTLAGTAGQIGHVDGTGAAARFVHPEATAVDPTTGDVYVVSLDGTVRKITPAGVVTTLAGNQGLDFGGGKDGTGNLASFVFPGGIAFDPTTGDLYVTDSGDSTLRRVTQQGVVTTIAGLPVQLGTADGAGDSARFDGDFGVAVNPVTGVVYVADWLDDRIRMVTPDGVVSSLAGKVGTPGTTDGTGSAAQFNSPVGVAVDPATGDVYVADENNDTIRRITPQGVVSTLAGSPGQPGISDGTGAAARFNRPYGLAFDPTTRRMYESDYNSQTIRMITLAGVVTTIAGIPEQTGTSDGPGELGLFNSPELLAVNPANGTLYVPDFANNTIREIAPPTVQAQPGLTGSAPIAISATVTGLSPNTTYFVRSVAEGPAGTALGPVVTSTTQVEPAITLPATNITATDATLNGTVNPQGLATTEDFIYGTDPTLAAGTTQTAVLSAGSGTADVPVSANLVGLTPQTTYFFEVEATGPGGTAHGVIRSFKTAATSLPLPTATTQPATNVTTTSATLNGIVNPEGVPTSAAFAFGTDSTLTVSTTTAAQTFGNGTADLPLSANLTGLLPSTTYFYRAEASNTATGTVATVAGSARVPGSTDGTGSAARFNFPIGIAVNPANGDVFVADSQNDTIRMVTPAGVVTTVAGSPGQSGSADGTGSAARFFDPTGVAFDPATGNLYVADEGNNTIRKITPAGVVTTIAGQAHMLGSDDGPGAQARFFGPEGIAFDTATGDIFVADELNRTIRKITPAGVVSTLAGTAGVVGNLDGTGPAAQFDGPTSVAVDPSTGNVYVADLFNDLIRKITPAGVVTTLAGSRLGAGSADGVGAAAQFAAPFGVAVDPSTGDVYVADRGAEVFTSTGTHVFGETIRKITPDRVVTTVAGVPGQPGSTDGSSGTALFRDPSGVAVDPVTSALYVADSVNDTIRHVTIGSLGTANTAAGPILSFTTLSLPSIRPTATTEPATALTTTSATLNGLVNPASQNAVVSFVYGTDPTLATGTATLPQSLDRGIADVASSSPLTGLAPNTTYFFRVVAIASGISTPGQILSFKTAAQVPVTSPPTVATLAATNITTTSATLNSTVDPNGSATSADFIFGTDPALATGTTTTPLAVGSGTTPLAEPRNLTSLAPGTTYYFRVVATSAGGTVEGAILHFTTQAATVVVPRPVAVTLPATNVTASSATLHASVNPEGATTGAIFDYGLTPNLIDAILTAPILVGGGTAAKSIFAQLTGLKPGETYYYEVVAVNNGGTVHGSILSFTTAPLTTPQGGPQVTSLARFGFHNQPTLFVLTFDSALDPARAQDVGNYQIVTLTGGRPGRPIPLAGAEYDAADHTVTLVPVRKVYLYGHYQLKVNGTPPSGLTDSAGRFLAGQGASQPGTNFVRRFGREILAGPNGATSHTASVFAASHPQPPSLGRASWRRSPAH